MAQKQPFVGSFSQLVALQFVLAAIVLSACGAVAPSSGAVPSSPSTPAVESTASMPTSASTAQPVATAANASAQLNPTPPSVVAEKPSGKLSTLLTQLADPALMNESAEAQAAALGIPASGAGSLGRDENGAVLVVVRMSSVAEADQQALRDVGARIVNVAEPYSTATVYIDPQRLNDLAALPAVQNVREELRT